MNLRETSGTEVIAFAIASDGLFTLRVSFTSILMLESGNTNMLHRCFCLCAPWFELNSDLWVYEVKRHAFPFKDLFWPKLWLLHGLIVSHICCALLRLYMCHWICHWDEWEHTLWPGICELVLAFLFILYAVDLNVDLAQQFCWRGLFCLSSLQLHQQIHHIVFSTTHPTHPNLFYLVQRSKNVLLHQRLIIHSKEPFCPLTHCTFFPLSVSFQLYQRHIWK